MALKVCEAMLTMAWLVWLARCSAFLVCMRYSAAVAAVDRMTAARMGPSCQDSAMSTSTCASDVRLLAMHGSGLQQARSFDEHSVLSAVMARRLVSGALHMLTSNVQHNHVLMDKQDAGNKAGCWVKCRRTAPDASRMALRPLSLDTLFSRKLRTVSSSVDSRPVSSAVEVAS